MKQFRVYMTNKKSDKTSDATFTGIIWALNKTNAASKAEAKWNYFAALVVSVKL